MTPVVFAAVMFAALLHAVWNGLVKTGGSSFQMMVLLSLAHGLTGIGMVLYFPPLAVAAWPWLAAAVVFHEVYKWFLMAAYARGDLSRVYPLARGSAPVLVLFVGYLLQVDQIAPMEILGILIVGFGILLMARGVFTSGESVQLLPYALMAAVGTAGYSLVDGIGARIAGSAGSFVGWLYLLDGFGFVALSLGWRGRQALQVSPRVWIIGLSAGFISCAAFGIVVWAMTIAPIALVAALRETSVLFAVLIGVVFFKEKSDRSKLVSAAVIVAGIVMIRL